MGLSFSVCAEISAFGMCGFSVCDKMSTQVSLSIKCLVARLASKPFLLAVLEGMSFQVRLSSERLITRLAGMNFWLCMCLEMNIQI